MALKLFATTGSTVTAVQPLNQFRYQAGNPTLTPRNDGNSSTIGAEWLIDPGSTPVLPPVSSLVAADGFWRIRVTTDWGARATAGAVFTPDGTDQIFGYFPTTGTEWVELIADQSGALNGGNPSWYVRSTAPVPQGIGWMVIGSSFVIA